MDRYESKTSVITEDAFNDKTDFTASSPAICLDLTEKSMEDMKEYSSTPHIFKFRIFESSEDVPETPDGWEDIYVIEVDGGKSISISTTTRANKTLKHITRKVFNGRCGRIALSGPVRDADNTVKMIHDFLSKFYGDYPNTGGYMQMGIFMRRLYPVDIFARQFKELQDAPDDANMFDIFCGTSAIIPVNLFEMMQITYYGEATDACLYPQNLIIPRVKFI